MQSSALVIPNPYQSSPRKTQVRSEDELLKFFLHGSYDVQRGAKVVCLPEEEKKTPPSSRCMFEETYMINISVKQPDAVPSSKQIDVRIEKTPADEISSIFDEEEEEDDDEEMDSVPFDELPATTLTLGDMINKTLTTIPTPKVDQLKNITSNHKWFMNKQEEIKTAKPALEELTTPKKLTANKSEDQKLFEYLDYLETKEDSSPIVPTKESPEPIPIVDLEDLCRSLTVNDLKDESIRKKIAELKVIIDERHRRSKSQIPLIKARRDHLPVLIAMPPATQQPRRRTTLIQSKTVNFVPPYYDLLPTPQVFARRSNPPTNNRKYQFT